MLVFLLSRLLIFGRSILLLLQAFGEFLSGSCVNLVEESIKSLFRELLQAGSRFCNGFLGFLLLLSGYHTDKKKRTATRSAWQNWAASSFSTLNLSYGHDDQNEEIPRTNGRRLDSDHGYLMFGKHSESLIDGHATMRGLLEDLRFAVELIISGTCAYFRKGVRCIFWLDHSSPKQAKWQKSKARRRLRKWKRLHTFTASDAILKAGYPLEECLLTTEDGYQIQMHRIPRRNSKKVVFFQHGVLDTSLGWVSRTTGGSVAFAAYDDGYDVWLGNTRANPPQINLKRKKSEYWRFSANELALSDLRCQFDHVKRVKQLELQSPEEQPSYSIKAVGHSLGAASLLMYAVHMKSCGLDHGLDRLIVLSPAGFHPKIPLLMCWCKYVFPLATWLVNMISPSRGIGLRLPSFPVRWITFKLMADVNNSPVFFDLFSLAFKIIFNGDTSEWTKAFSLPHYNPRDMPAVSLHLANHFAQWARQNDFRFYDYGSPDKNMEVYGRIKPPSIAKQYHLLQDLPIDIAGGTSDGLIPPQSASRHQHFLQKAHVPCTMSYFDYGHLEFIFGVGEELLSFIINRLNTPTSL